MAYGLFGPSDEELIAASRALNAQRAEQYAQSYRRPGRARIGAMLGSAVGASLFGLKTPQQQELAKRAQLKAVMDQSGIDFNSEPEKYLSTFSAAANKLGLTQYAERATAKMEELRKYNTELAIKKRELGQKDTANDIDAQGVAAQREATAAANTRHANELNLDRSKATMSSVLGPAQPGENPKVAAQRQLFSRLVGEDKISEEVAALIQVDELGNLSFAQGSQGQNIGGARASAGGAKNAFDKRLPDNKNVSTTTVNFLNQYSSPAWQDYKDSMIDNWGPDSGTMSEKEFISTTAAAVEGLARGFITQNEALDATSALEIAAEAIARNIPVATSPDHARDLIKANKVPMINGEYVVVRPNGDWFYIDPKTVGAK